MEDAGFVPVDSWEAYVPAALQILNAADNSWFYSWVREEYSLVCRPLKKLSNFDVYHFPALQLSET